MDFRERQERDRVVDQYLKEKADLGIPFAIFAIASILGLIGLFTYYAFFKG